MEDVRILLERSIYEYIRLALVESELTPDITEFENTPLGYTQYLAALASIKTSKGFAVELFNHSTILDKGLKQVPRIVLSFTSFTPGEWGGDPGKYIKRNQDGKYQAFRDDILSVQLFFTCYVLSKTTSQERSLWNILNQMLPPFSFVPYYTDSTQTFFVEFISTADLSDNSVGIFEKSLYFKVPDILLNEAREIAGLIPDIREITINTKIANHLGLNFIKL